MIMNRTYCLKNQKEKDEALKFLLSRKYSFIKDCSKYPEDMNFIAIDFTNQLLSFRLFTKETQQTTVYLKKNPNYAILT